jgi:hypothetical protein
MSDSTFELQQGIQSPRDGSINWQTYEVYERLAEAKKEAGKIKNALWQIVESKIVWRNERAQELLEGAES